MATMSGCTEEIIWLITERAAGQDDLVQLKIEFHN